jgi:hypothetical protein
MILQYTIGLITSFEGSGSKSGATWEDLYITAPPDFTATPGKRFEIPLTLTTPASVKSIDLQLSTKPQHLQFIGLNYENLPPDIMVASGYREGSGDLKVSFASAYDLGLNLHELGLIFELKDPQTESSEIQLTKLMANETLAGGPMFTTRVESGTGTTELKNAGYPASVNIYAENGRFVADLHLASEPSKLVFSIYDMRGRLTNRRIVETPGAGQHRFLLKPEAGGGGEPSGIYLITIQGDDFNLTRKLVVR